jgi:hypothetical protein
LSGFDQHTLRIKNDDAAGTYIVFAGAFDLTEAQLAILGVVVGEPDGKSAIVG